jgi:hypothetical protein
MDVQYPQKKRYVKLIESQPMKPPIVQRCINLLGHEISRMVHTNNLYDLLETTVEPGVYVYQRQEGEGALWFPPSASVIGPHKKLCIPTEQSTATIGKPSFVQ